MTDLQSTHTGLNAVDWLDRGIHNNNNNNSSSSGNNNNNNNNNNNGHHSPASNITSDYHSMSYSHHNGDVSSHHGPEAVHRFQSYYAQLPPISAAVPAQLHDPVPSASSASAMNSALSPTEDRRSISSSSWVPNSRDDDSQQPYHHNHGQPTPSPSASTEKSANRKYRAPSTKDMHVEKNTEGKPPYSYATLIKYAIENSSQKKLTLSEIYQWVIEHYPYYSTAGTGWKNSIRHNLSLNKSFVRVARPINEPGKGSYWTVDYRAAEAEATSHRPRHSMATRGRTTRSVSDPHGSLATPYRPESWTSSSSASQSTSASMTASSILTRRFPRDTRSLSLDAKSANYNSMHMNGYPYYGTPYGYSSRSSFAQQQQQPPHSAHSSSARSDLSRNHSTQYVSSGGYNLYTMDNNLSHSPYHHSHPTHSHHAQQTPQQRQGSASSLSSTSSSSSSSSAAAAATAAAYGVYEPNHSQYGHNVYPSYPYGVDKSAATETPSSMYQYPSTPTATAPMHPLLTPPSASSTTSSPWNSQSTHAASHAQQQNQQSQAQQHESFSHGADGSQQGFATPQPQYRRIPAPAVSNSNLTSHAPSSPQPSKKAEGFDWNSVV